MTSFSERQKAELRDAIARSRIEYDEERKARRKQMRLVPVPRVDPFEMVAELAEIATSIGIATADFSEDAELGRAVLSLQWQATRVGNILARRRRKESTADARPDGAKPTLSERGETKAGHPPGHASTAPLAERELSKENDRGSRHRSDSVAPGAAEGGHLNG